MSTSALLGIGQAFAARAIEVNARNGITNYTLRDEELFAVFQMGGETVEIKQDVPTVIDIKAILTQKHNFRPQAITKEMIRSFQLGYTMAYINHILTTQDNG